jgi:AraC-like DNA-binding protein/mannose-6-phosphate isomerase-like protein (cupin superfamily)
MEDYILKTFKVEEDSFRIRYANEKTYVEMKEEHTHDNYEMYYLLHGEKIFVINNKAYKVKKGEMICIHPSDIHRSLSVENIALESILINFKEKFIEDFFKDKNMNVLKESLKFTFSLKDQGRIEKILFDILSECERKEENYIYAVKSLQILLMINIQRYYERDITININNTIETKMEQISKYISQNYDKEITLDKLSKEFFLSSSYISRSFKRINGCNISEYIQILRISEAQKLLISTNEKVFDIAYRVGFKEIAHFNKTFKKFTNISPLKYRKSTN